MNNDTNEAKWREEWKNFFSEYNKVYKNGFYERDDFERFYLSACKKREEEIEIFQQREWEKLANIDKQIEELEQENARLREALEFYSDPNKNGTFIDLESYQELEKENSRLHALLKEVEPIIDELDTLEPWRDGIDSLLKRINNELDNQGKEE